MSAIAALKDLQQTNEQIKNLFKSHPQAMKEISEIIKNNRMIGYRNICMMINGKTPEQLKGIE